ncbi:MAG: hypothetical protein HY331_09350 [Chloroflexi bacterium]|nr:hypothetical protein [Chloroflexota bacterium]
MPDPLGVLQTTRPVVERARTVRIDPAAVESLAARFVREELRPPAWDQEIHFDDGTWRTANYVVALDALNFCFWGEPRWTVVLDGRRLNGYWALAVAVKRAVVAGVPIWDADFLGALTRAGLADILRGDGEIPMLDERLANLHEAGAVLNARYGGRFTVAVEEAGFDAPSLTALLAQRFPSFDDVATYAGQTVRFYKRAQICAADLFGAFQGRDWGNLARLDCLTAFADYKVPQVLRRFGVLLYAPDLADRVDRRVELPAGSPEEVEIRAATIWGVELLRQALAARGRPIAAYELDWYLWQLGQTAPADERPYHRTRTIFY